MRNIEFKMELNHPEIVIGKEVEVEESELQDGLVVYYTIIPAIAMSGNFKRQDALKSRKGKVTEIRKSEGGAFYVSVDFED